MTLSTKNPDNSPFSILIKTFEELSPFELYDILALRNEVFVVEQHAIYNDTDYADQKSHHLMLYDGDELASYIRLIPKGIKYEEASIGRVVTNPNHRYKGYSRLLMIEGMKLENQLNPTSNGIRISAQSYLQQFYGSLGFVVCSEEYLEDGLPHVEMVFTR
jgi:ElaA protein